MSIGRLIHISLMLLNIPAVLICLYLFGYAFMGLWSPGIARIWWWLTVLALPMMVMMLGFSSHYWRTGSVMTSNVLAAMPVAACAPIFAWIVYALVYLT